MFTGFANLKVGKKLGLGFGLMALLLAGMVLYTISEVTKSRVLVTGVIDVRTPTAMQSLAMLNGMNHSLAALRGWMILGKDRFKAERTESWSKEIDAPLAELKKLSSSWIVQKNIESLKTIESKVADFRKYQQEVEDLTQTNYEQAKLIMSEKAAPTAFVIKGILKEMVESQEELLKAKGAEATALVAALNKALWILFVVGLVISGALGFGITRSISAPIEKVVSCAKSISEGNLRVEKLQVTSTDEIGVLGSVFNELLDGLKDFIRHSGEILGGKTDNAEFGVQGDFKKALDGMLNQAREKQKADFETAKIRSMVENMPMNMMFADENFTLQYMNPESARTFKTVEQYLPVKGDAMIGQSIDIFHKNPNTIRKILSDPRNFPHKALIQLGPETLELNISAIYDQNQKYIGPMVSWTVVTAKVEMERKAKEMAEREREQAKDLEEKVDSMLLVVDAAASGNLTQEITVNGNSSIGRMGAGLKKFFAALRTNIIDIGRISNTLASSSEEMSAVSSQMAGNAQETSVQAGVVSAASQQVSQNVQTVATGIEEMSASIREIAKNAGDAARVATAAVKIVEETNSIIGKLGMSSAEIGQVIKVITSIAEQTNLLALNATIEAARAGEAGKGFAVVAGEVKELAKETSKATDDIGKKINAIQNDTGDAVRAIGEITKIINQVNDISNTIASAVEEQTSTTTEIGRNVTEAAKAVEEITQNIGTVAQAAQDTSEGASHSQKTSTDLSSMASSLQGVVGQFTC